RSTARRGSATRRSTKGRSATHRGRATLRKHRSGALGPWPDFLDEVHGVPNAVPFAPVIGHVGVRIEGQVSLEVPVVPAFGEVLLHLAGVEEAVAELHAVLLAEVIDVAPAVPTTLATFPTLAPIARS